jgi:hypothetical protein
MFQSFYVGSGSCTPELHPLSPNWFEYGFIDVPPASQTFIEKVQEAMDK